MNANEIFSYVQALEAENQKLQKSVENLLETMEEQKTDSGLVEDVKGLLALLSEDIKYQEKRLPKMPEGKRAEMGAIIEAYRKVERAAHD